MLRQTTTFIIALGFSLSSLAQQNRYSFNAIKMAAPLSIILYSTDSVSAAKIANKSFALVDSLVNIFSDYIDSSELNRLSARAGSNQPMKVSTPMLELLLKAKQAAQLSGGSFDITVGPLSLLWRKARKQNQLPADSLVKQAIKFVGYQKIKICKANNTVLLLQRGMRLDAGGIAQGYIAQQVIHLIQSENISNALVNVSGDIAAIGAPPGKKGWSVGINQPEEANVLQSKTLLISNRAVTTSGDVFQHIDNNKKRYSHIIDPRTGYGITNQRNVTVIAASGTDADWFTKACSILSFKQAKKIAKKLNAGILTATLKNGKIINRYNTQFARFMVTK